VARLVLLSCGMTPEELRSRTKKFATDVVQFCETLPRNSRAQEIAAQLVDAASGVGSNYRSVCRARSRADFINKLSIALDCADESLYWLQLLIESNVADTPHARRHRAEAEELTKILAASRNTARRNRRNPEGGANDK
jgi:four helix bundle protein